MVHFLILYRLQLISSLKHFDQDFDNCVGLTTKVEVVHVARNRKLRKT